MDITCQSCQTKLSIPEDRLPKGVPAVTGTCPNCKNSIEIRLDGVRAPAPVPAAAAPPATAPAQAAAPPAPTNGVENGHAATSTPPPPPQPLPKPPPPDAASMA